MKLLYFFMNQITKTKRFFFFKLTIFINKKFKLETSMKMKKIIILFTIIITFSLSCMEPNYQKLNSPQDLSTAVEILNMVHSASDNTNPKAVDKKKLADLTVNSQETGQEQDDIFYVF
jgi:hypothetical protein